MQEEDEYNGNAREAYGQGSPHWKGKVKKIYMKEVSD